MVMHKKIVRTMLAHKAPYLGSFILIILSCLIFTVFGMASFNLDRNNRAFQQDYAREDVHFAVQQPIDNVRQLEQRYHVRLEKRLSFDAKLGGGTSLRVMTVGKKINRPYLVKGKPIHSDHELLIDAQFAKAHNLTVGDRYTVDQHSFRISGLFMMPDYIYVIQSLSESIADNQRFGIALLTPQAFASLQRGTPSYSLTFAKGADRSAFKSAVDRRYGLSDWLDADENPRIMLINQDIQSMDDMGGLLSTVILLMTCTLIGIVLRRTLKQEYVQIGTLYALGYRKKEILHHYLAYARLIALGGSIVGTLLGLAAYRPVLNFFTSYYNVPELQTHWHVTVLVIALLLPSLFLIPTAWLIIRRALRLSPVDLMHGGRAQTKVGFLESHLRLGRLPFNLKFRIRELLRNVPRALLLLFGVGFASLLLLVGFGIDNSMHDLIDRETDHVLRYNYDYRYQQIRTAHEEEGEAYSAYAFSPAGQKRTLSNTFQVYGIAPDTDYLRLDNAGGKPIDPARTIITRPLADRLDVEAGDTVRVNSAVNDKTYPIRIDRIADVYTGSAIYMPNGRLNKLLKNPAGAHNGVFSNHKLAIDDDRLAYSSSKKENRERMESFLAPMQSVYALISAGAFLIGLIIIYVVTSLVVEENKETISMLKVFGYRKKEVGRLVLGSNTVLVAAGYLLSIPLLLQLLRALFRYSSESANLALPVRVSGWSFLIGFLVMFLAYQLAQWSGKRKINRIPLSAILKSRME